MRLEVISKEPASKNPLPSCSPQSIWTEATMNTRATRPLVNHTGTGIAMKYIYATYDLLLICPLTGQSAWRGNGTSPHMPEKSHRNT